MQPDMLVIAGKNARLAEHLRKIIFQHGRFGRKGLRYDLLVVREGAVDDAGNKPHATCGDGQLRLVGHKFHILILRPFEYVSEFLRMFEWD